MFFLRLKSLLLILLDLFSVLNAQEEKPLLEFRNLGQSAEELAKANSLLANIVAFDRQFFFYFLTKTLKHEKTQHYFFIDNPFCFYSI